MSKTVPDHQDCSGSDDDISLLCLVKARAGSQCVRTGSMRPYPSLAALEPSDVSVGVVVGGAAGGGHGLSVTQGPKSCSRHTKSFLTDNYSVPVTQLSPGHAPLPD